MRLIGKIDIEIYKCIDNDITTDEVIITDERLRHIRERHPGDYESIEQYLQKALMQPDYILKDKLSGTGLVLKSVNEGGLRFQIVLRVHTSKDLPGFKNSVLSVWKIGVGRWKSYLKNRIILYKREKD